MSTISLLLQPLPNYRFNSVINNTSYTFEITYNTRQGIYHLSVYDQDNTAVYLGVALTPQVFDGYSFEGGVLCMFPNFPDIDFNSVPATEVSKVYSLFWTDEFTS